MSIPRRMARKAWAISLTILIFPQAAQAANYDSGSWFLTPAFSYEVINPSDLNAAIGNLAPLQGLVGGRLQVERGLFGPGWSHWVEVGYYFGTATGADDFNTFLYEQKLSHLSVLPLGATFWFHRTAYIDFGASLGVGVGFSPRLEVISTPSNGTAATTNVYTGGVSPIVDARMSGRFWLGKYIGFTLTGGARYYGPGLSGNAGTLNANLLGFSLVTGVTVAFGGVKGTGRTYVEVLPASQFEGLEEESAASRQQKRPTRKAAPKR